MNVGGEQNRRGYEEVSPQESQSNKSQKKEFCVRIIARSCVNPPRVAEDIPEV